MVCGHDLFHCDLAFTDRLVSGCRHTDWPHMVHGGSRAGAPPESHMGSIRKRDGQPFPDVTMCLSCVWYLTEVSAAGGAGTWVVPGSHRSDRNPFGT